MLRLILAVLCAAAACMLVASALFTSAQSPASSTPDPFVAQITNGPAGRDSSAGDTTANGRFVVIESDGDIATEKTATRHNQDGNREIFLFDYAQRRIFQLTDTRSVLKPATSPSPTPSPSPSPSVSPTASPSPTPFDPTTVAIEISNNRPMISLAPTLSGGNRTYVIVFSSNAPVTPASFDGTDPGAPTNADMNQEIWTYQFTVPDTADLSSGAEVGPVDLTTGTFTRVTNTPASRAPSPATSSLPAFIADDNRDASISDDGNLIAFISTRDIVAGGNVDTGVVPNPEVFLFNRTGATFTQVTNTKSTSDTKPIFSSNPCLSSDGSVLAFISNANLAAANADGNAEIYIRDGAGLRQVTKTKDTLDANGHEIATATIFSFGRRLSRDGKFIAFESMANDPKADGANSSFRVSFVYNVAADTFAQLGPRATEVPGDVITFATFTDYDGALSPGSVLFTSFLNFKSDGTLLAAADSTGLNPLKALQVFLAPLPVAAAGPFTRLTNTVGPPSAGLRALPSSTRRRIAFSLSSTELGGGNSDFSKEVFYQLSPSVTTESAATISLFTGASLMPVASPVASPNPSASPTASPAPGVPNGLAAGELAVAQFTLSPPPVPASVSNSNASESKRSPALPIELNGVSISINGAACGIYSVTATSISFVVPIGLLANTGTASYPIVINNNGTVIRGLVAIVPAQPDVFTTTNGPGGRAIVCNVTNPLTPGCLTEPFNVTSDNGSGTQVPTVLEIHLTGVRNTLPALINVTIGSTAIIPSKAILLDQPGFEEIDITLPATVDRGDLPIVVTVGTASSRPAATGPKVTINP